MEQLKHVFYSATVQSIVCIKQHLIHLDKVCIHTYGTAQFKLDIHNMHVEWAQLEAFFILHMCKCACAHKIDNIKLIIQRSHVHVCIRHVHDSLQMHVAKELHAFWCA